MRIVEVNRNIAPRNTVVASKNATDKKTVLSGSTAEYINKPINDLYINNFAALIEYLNLGLDAVDQLVVDKNPKIARAAAAIEKNITKLKQSLAKVASINKRFAFRTDSKKADYGELLSPDIIKRLVDQIDLAPQSPRSHPAIRLRTVIGNAAAVAKLLYNLVDAEVGRYEDIVSTRTKKSGINAFEQEQLTLAEQLLELWNNIFMFGMNHTKRLLKDVIPEVEDI